MKYILATSLALVLLVSTGKYHHRVSGKFLCFGWFSSIIESWRYLFYHTTALLVTGDVETGKDNIDGVKIDESLKAGKETNAGSLKTEEEAIKLDGLSVKELKDLTEKVKATTFSKFPYFSFMISAKMIGKFLWILKGHVSRNAKLILFSSFSSS